VGWSHTHIVPPYLYHNTQGTSVPKRNQSKAKKFFANVGNIDPSVMAWFNGSGRNGQTEIINGAFDLAGKEFVLNTDKPFFKQCKDRYHYTAGIEENMSQQKLSLGCDVFRCL
jgi:hypothetical protein